MWAASGRPHDSRMRIPQRLSKTVAAAVLGALALTACGTADATGRPPAKATAVDAAAPAKPTPTPTSARKLPSDALADDPDPEARFLSVLVRVMEECTPGGLPDPSEIPEEAEPPSGPMPDKPPLPEEPPLSEEVPLPEDAPVPTSSPAPARTGPVEEVALDPLDRCAGDAHAERVRPAFAGRAPAGFEALRKGLTELDYPPSRIHRMPDHQGAPRARLDLRFMGNHLVLEITGTTDGVRVEPFGVPETEDVDVTEVRRKPSP